MLRNIIIFCFIVGFLISARLAQANDLVMALSNWVPYKSETMDGGGIVTDLTREALQAAGYSVYGSFLPWRRALTGTYEGLYDVIPAIWQSAERDEFLLFSDPVINSRLVIASLRSKPFDFKELSELAGLRVGVSAGWRYPDAFNALTTIRRDEAKDLKENLRKLLRNRVDVVIGEELAVRHTLQEFFPDEAADIYYAATRIESYPLRVAVSKKHPKAQQVIRDFNQALDRLYSNGRYHEILKHHGIVDVSFVAR